VTVSPYWRTSLAPVGRIGNHLFYRMFGWRGTAAALTGQYNEDEHAPSLQTGRPTGVFASAARAGPPPPRSVEFTVWGLKMATITVNHDHIDVKAPS
jgi:hypothetical protein